MYVGRYASDVSAGLNYCPSAVFPGAVDCLPPAAGDIVYDEFAGGIVASVGEYFDGVGLSASFLGIAKLALSEDEETLFVADTGNQIIRAISLTTGMCWIQ